MMAKAPVIGIMFLSICSALYAQQPSKAPADRNKAGLAYFTDVALVNQHGKEMRFYSDLIKGKVVVMIPFFTTCTSICPPMNRNLQRIQDWLGDRLGKDVHMMSISVDPEYDTPPRLKSYASRYKAKPGWYFLSGKKANVDLALKKIGQYVNEKDSHSSVMIVGNDSTGLWKKAQALAKIEELLPVVESVLQDKGK
jgi:protein SCO1/2